MIMKKKKNIVIKKKIYSFDNIIKIYCIIKYYIYILIKCFIKNRQIIIILN